MSANWLEQRERGTLASLRLMSWLTLTLGYRLGRALLYPICLYFILFSPGARSASRAFLSRVNRSAASLREVFRHFHVFASTLLDRVEILAGRDAEFEVRLHGIEALESRLASKRGCLLLGSHFGSFEILRVIGEAKRNVRVNLVMHEDNSRRMSQWLRARSPELAERIIAPGQADTLLKVRERLQRGELVAVLGDRVFAGERTVACEFLGAVARFPAGPVLAAALLEVPVVTFFCVYRGPRRYEAYFELLALDKFAVAEGEYWRLFSVTLLHGGFLHLIFNMYALFIVGPIVEALYGRALFVLIYLLSAATGSVASYLFFATPSVGASGAIFGLFGVLLTSTYVHKPALGRQARGLTGQIALLIGLNLALGFGLGGLARIDNAAHVGGLVAGAWLGFVIVPHGAATLASFWQRVPGTADASGGGASALRIAAVLALVAAILVGLSVRPLWA